VQSFTDLELGKVTNRENEMVSQKMNFGTLKLTFTDGIISAAHPGAVQPISIPGISTRILGQSIFLGGAEGRSEMEGSGHLTRTLE